MADIYGECGEKDSGCHAHDENGFCAKSKDDPVHTDNSNISFHKFVCGCKVSTGICGCLTYGTGKLDFNGYWEIPCPHHSEVHNCLQEKD